MSGKKRKPKTLFDREMERSDFRRKYDSEREAFDLEVQLLNMLELANISLASLARQLGVPRSNVSRDLAGGIRRATLPRVGQIARALNADFVPVLLPHERAGRREVIQKLKKVYA
jgi:transcriptional regulator with XRE-family HTH domain